VAAIVVVVLAVAAGVAAAVHGSFGRAAGLVAVAGNAYRTSTATVTRQSLSAQTQVDATLGDAGSYSVVNQVQGTITALPAVGQVVREGQAVYQVSGSPVVLLYGSVPAYRDLSEGVTGPDVTELNADLVRLRYATSSELDPSSDDFSLATADALEALQAHLGLTVTGDLPLGQAVFLPTAAEITGVGASAVLGGTAQPGSAILTASSTRPVVTIDLDASQQTDVKDGENVTITLPDGRNTPGVISSVAAVASQPSSSSQGNTSNGSSSSSSSSSSGGSDSGATITVQATLTDPKAADGLNQEPVVVTITTASAANVLVVPVDALLAQPGGGYAVEVTGARGHQLVPVSLGLFDDAAGLVQVIGSDLTPGQRVVVPAT
jgi:hypothetical protein